MSLKAVHLIFVTALSAMLLGCAVWKVRQYASPSGTGADLAWAGLAVAGTVLTLFYGRYFLRKLRTISYL
jgi:hypothetical protein